MTSASLTADLKQQALRLGFSFSGACPAVTPHGISRLAEWLSAGNHGEMQYLADRKEAYAHPKHVLDGVRSMLMLAVNYGTTSPASPTSGSGRISRYAWGDDYHDLIWSRLNDLSGWLREQQPGVSVRGVVDTAPLLEREFAQLAGLGWVGKNTMLLNRTAGSWFFIAALLTDAELDYDAPFDGDFCGTCTACLDACPTDAFVEPYVLDARKCISYLTIELKSEIPAELRSGMGEWLFGCDACQDVCPWNRRAPTIDEPKFQPRPNNNPVELTALFDLDDDAFRKRFRETPLWRPRRRGILRNAAIVLGNHRSPDAIPAITKGLHDKEALVRGAAAWALGRHDYSEATAALERRLLVEIDAEVRGEIEAALSPRH